MQNRTTRSMPFLLTLALAGAAFSAPAVAATSYDAHHRHAYRPHYRSSDVTVRKSNPRPDAYAHDAFHGPAAIITAPVTIAGTFVSMPFRAIDMMFPRQAQDPRVVVGAPAHFAGQVATFPFYAVDRAFGAEPGFYNYN